MSNDQTNFCPVVADHCQLTLFISKQGGVSIFQRKGGGFERYSRIREFWLAGHPSQLLAAQQHHHSPPVWGFTKRTQHSRHRSCCWTGHSPYIRPTTLSPTASDKCRTKVEVLPRSDHCPCHVTCPVIP